MSDYRATLEQFRSLPHDWDSYGGRPTTQMACETLLRMAGYLPHDQGLQPQAIVPLPCGGVRLEWHICGLDAELEVNEDGEVSSYLERGAEERSYQGEDGVLLFGRALRELLTPWAA